MKRIITMLLVLLTGLHSFTQQPPCAAQIHYDRLMQSSPGFREKNREANLRIKDYIDRHLKTAVKKNNGALNGPDVVFGSPAYVIPVVVHVLHTGQPVGSGTNISYNQIRSQIDALNAAFARVYGTAGYPNGQSHPAYAVNTGIQFCLARIVAGPPGWTNPNEPGVMRYNAGNALSNPDYTQADAAAIFNFTHPNNNFFPVDRYMNIWLVNTIGGGNSILGYATFPLNNGFAPLDGMVMRADCFGDNSVNGNSFPLNTNSTQGKIAAHEAGHYLNLLHIFEGGCAGMNAAGSPTDPCDLNGDNICDIAPATTQGYNCTDPIPNTCNENYATGTTASDMVEDYMSYARDLCMTTFTADQRSRMQATLNTLRPGLWTQENLVNTGVAGPNSECVPGILLATINRPANICTNQPVQYTTNTNPGNTATTWNWQFQGGTPAISTLQTPPTVTYAAAGTYTVTLTVTDGLGNTRTNTITVFVSTCQLDPCKLSQAHWYFGRGAAIDFNSGAPVPNATAILPNLTINSDEAATTVSDANSGSLIYYGAPNQDVRNSVHGLFAGGALPGNTSLSQMLSAPFPGHPGQYYIFIPGAAEANAPLRYVVVDVAGAGSIITPSTVAPSHPSNPTGFVAEGITGVPHCNGRDYWIIVRGVPGDHRFYVYLLSPHGLTNGTLSSLAPDVYPQSGSFNFASVFAGQQLKASPDTRHLSYTAYAAACAIYDFNNETGTVSNENIVTFPDAGGTMGNSFSPNSQYVYVGSNDGSIRKIDISNFTHSAILAAGAGRSYSKLQLGPDNRVYLTNQAGSNNTLSRIDNPDNPGVNNVTVNAVDFAPVNGGIRVLRSIPNFIDACPLPETHPECFATPLDCSTYVFSVNDCWDMYQLRWNFGDNTPTVTGSPVTHTYAQPGNYTVTVQFIVPLTGEVFFECTQTVTVIDLNLTINGPDTACANAVPPPVYSVPNIPGASYNWQVINGQIIGSNTGSSITVNWPTVGMGWVIVKMTFQGCRVTDTLKVTIINCDTPSCRCGNWQYTRWTFVKNINGNNQWVSANFNCGDTLQPGLMADSTYSFFYRYMCTGECNPVYLVSSSLPSFAYSYTVVNGELRITYTSSYRYCGLNYFRVTPVCGKDTCPPCTVYFRQNCSPCGEIIKDTVYCDPKNGPTYDFCVQNNSSFTAYLIKVKIPANINPVNITAPAGATYSGNAGGYYSFLYPAGLPPQQSLCGFRFSIAQPYTAGQMVCLGLALHKEIAPPFISCCEDTLYKRCFTIPDCRIPCGEILQDTIVCTDKGPVYSFCVKNNSNFTAYLIKIKIPAGVNPVNIIPAGGATYAGSSGGYYSFLYPAGLPTGQTLCTFSFTLAQPYTAGQVVCLGLALHKEIQPPYISCCEDTLYKRCFTIPDCPVPCGEIVMDTIVCTGKGPVYSFCVKNNLNFTAYLIKVKIPAGINPVNITAPAGATYAGNSGGYYSFLYPAGLPTGQTLCTFSFTLAQPYYPGQQICLGLALHKETKPPFITCCEDSTYKKCFIVPDCPDPCMDIERPSIDCRLTPKGYEYTFSFSIVNHGLLEMDSLELQYVVPPATSFIDLCNWRLIPAVPQNGSGGVFTCTLPGPLKPGSLLCFRVIGYDLHWLGGVWCIKDSCISEMVCITVPDCGKGEDGGGGEPRRFITAVGKHPGAGQQPESFRVFPNPVSSMVTITSPDAPDAIQTVTLTSVTGQVLLRQRAVNAQRFTMDMTKLKTGMYFITINNRYQFKVIKE